MFREVVVYIPDMDDLIVIEEGTGDNLLHEDIENGYLDYVNYDVFHCVDPEDIDMLQASDWELETDPDDGGMFMYKEYVQDLFSCIDQCIPDVLLDIYDEMPSCYRVFRKEN